LLLLYNRTCKKPNHVALLLDLLVLLLSHTRWKPPKKIIPWRLPKSFYTDMCVTSRATTQTFPIHNNTFSLVP
jgi:hypothetical protein